MGISGIVGTKGISSGGSFIPSLLEMATLCPELGDSLGIDLFQAPNPSAGSETITWSGELAVSKLAASNSIVDLLSPLTSQTPNSNSSASFDPLTGVSDNAPIVNLAAIDPLIGRLSTGNSKSDELISLEMVNDFDKRNNDTSLVNSAAIDPQKDALSTSNSKSDELLSLLHSSDFNESNDTHSTINAPGASFVANDALVNTLSTSNSLNDELISLGKFGDFDGRDDFQLEIKGTNGEILETFSLVGDGYGEVFKDDFNEYVLFSGTDETTSVQISAINNLKLDDYIGSKLSVQTDGSISAGDIALHNTNISSNPGLVLRSGLSDVQNSGSGISYRITDLGVLPGGSYSNAYGINNKSQVVGESDDSNGPSHAFLYSDGLMTDLGTLLPGGYSYAYGINNRSQIVGISYGYTDEAFLYHAFLYSDGWMTDLGTLSGGTYSEAYGINDRGQVVGISDSSAHSGHAFLYSDGWMTDLGTLPGHNSSFATSINNRSQVVGWSSDQNWVSRAFLYSDGWMTDLGALPGHNSSFATSINDRSQVVGRSSDQNWVSRAFLYSDGWMTDLGTLPGTDRSSAYDINNSGEIVGSSSNINNVFQAFLYSNGLMTDLNSLIPKDSGWILEEATAINDLGQIVGNGTINEQQRAFLLDPISPSTATPSDGIKVGNISTLGDSISLQGMEINLTGEQVTTRGGNITFDGPTLLNSKTGALTINSTITTANSRGGDIIFNNTLNGGSAATQSFNLTAGKGNIIFNSSVGGSAALKDFAVSSAKSFTAADITTDGDTTLKATQDITAGKLVSQNGAAKLTSGKGAVVTSDITSGDDTTITAAQGISTGDILSNTGAVKLTSKTSFITTSDISTGGNATAPNSKVNITLTAADDITTGNISTHSLGKVSITLKQDTAVADPNSGDVTTGSINAKQIDILSDGGFTAKGDIETNKGDVNITTTQDIVTQKITARNGAVSLVSGEGGITVTGEINSDEGLAAKAKQNISTNKILSSTGAVVLSSSQGAVTASGEIASSGNVALGALEDLITQDITSRNGVVSLVSKHGAATVTGMISSDGNVSITALEDVVTQDITSHNGAIGLWSAQGAVTIQGEIDSGGSIAVLANQNVTTGKIISQRGTVTLDTKQGTITIQGEVTTNGGDINISADGDVVSQNIISNGGTITLASSQDVVTTGFLRSDGNDAEGNVYVQAAGLVRATGSALINGIDCSIYTGNGAVIIQHGGGATLTPFVVGDAATNGTAAAISNGNTTLTPSSILGRYTLGNIRIITADAYASVGTLGNTDSDSLPNRNQQLQQGNQPPVVPFTWWNPPSYALVPEPPDNSDHTKGCFSILKQIQDILNGFRNNKGEWEKGLIQRYEEMRIDREDLYKAYIDAQNGDTQAEDYNKNKGLGTWQGHRSKYEKQQQKLQKLLKQWEDSGCDNDDASYLEGEDILGLAEQYKNQKAPQQPDPKNKFQIPIQIPNIEWPDPREWFIPIFELKKVLDQIAYNNRS